MTQPAAQVAHLQPTFQSLRSQVDQMSVYIAELEATQLSRTPLSPDALIFTPANKQSKAVDYKHIDCHTPTGHAVKARVCGDQCVTSAESDGGHTPILPDVPPFPTFKETSEPDRISALLLQVDQLEYKLSEQRDLCGAQLIAQKAISDEDHKAECDALLARIEDLEITCARQTEHCNEIETAYAKICAERTPYPEPLDNALDALASTCSKVFDSADPQDVQRFARLVSGDLHCIAMAFTTLHDLLEQHIDPGQMGPALARTMKDPMIQKMYSLQRLVNKEYMRSLG